MTERTVIVLADAAALGERLDRFLADRLPEVSRSQLKHLFGAGLVTVNGIPARGSLKLKGGERISVTDLQREHAEADEGPMTSIPILYEDDYLLVVNKPRGIASHPAPSLKRPSLVECLIAQGAQLGGGEAHRPGIVHRLDRPTTGLMLVAKQQEVHRKLAAAIAAREVDRIYLANVEGDIGATPFLIEAPIRRNPNNRLKMQVHHTGRPSATRIFPLKAVGSDSQVLAKLETGRTHQVRVHLSELRHPVVGDQLYGTKSELPLQLHSLFVRFRHPVLGREVSALSPPPPDFVHAESIEDLEEAVRRIFGGE